jgi:hypothetical protein
MLSPLVGSSERVHFAGNNWGISLRDADDPNSSQQSDPDFDSFKSIKHKRFDFAHLIAAKKKKIAESLLSPNHRKLELPFSNSPWRSIKPIPPELVQEEVS